MIDGRAHAALDHQYRPDVADFLGTEKYVYSGYFDALSHIGPGEHELSVVSITRDRRSRFQPTPPFDFTLS